jgi:hypothetical protein
MAAMARLEETVPRYLVIAVRSTPPIKATATE